MSRESSSAAFRAQLAIPEQRELFDYWLAQAKGRPMPCRADLKPSHFPRLLPAISLMEVVGPAQSRLRVRLAGTRLRDIYDREITGFHMDDFDLGEKQDYWMAAYRRVIETGKPAQGAVRGPRLNKDHLVQFWLRLPLACEDGRVGMILCHDDVVSAVDVPGHVDEEQGFGLPLARRA